MQTVLDRALEHERARAAQVYLTQPTGGGATVDYTWAETMDQARRMATHLRHERRLAPGARVAILARNSAHFFMAELAIWMAGGSTVAIYPTETAATLRYVLEHSGASLLFIGRLDDWPAQQPGVPPGLPCITLPLAPASGFEEWDAVIARTAPLEGHIGRGSDEVAMLMYTSGSTGRPKGALHTFGGVSAVSQARIAHRLQWFGYDLEEHRSLSYLPLAHCFERAAVECLSFWDGRVRVYFNDTQASFLEDLRRARPTTFCSVPRIWSKLRQSVIERIGAERLTALLADPGSAPATRQGILEGLGLDQAELAITGSAPLPPEVLAWYRALGLELYEGYAMTEDFAYSHFSAPEARTPGHVGRPLPGVTARLADDGEVLVRSPGRMTAYYGEPELTAASFTADGFFRTGDLGQYNANGELKLIGRKKELFKTAKGKYVAPAPIETLLNRHPMVEVSLVQGQGQSAAHALVVLEESLRHGARESAERARIGAELARLRAEVNACLPNYEQLKFIAVAREPWSVANGCLTPTLKIRRAAIEASVAPEVEAWYRADGPVVWT